MTGDHDVSQLTTAELERAKRPADRPYDVSNLTSAELERARRDLHVSLALAFPGSPARVPILASLGAIDTELAGRTANEDHDWRTHR